MTRYASILETVGRTPLVRLARLAPPDINVHVKVEAFNPMGSVKDRMALAVIEAAERSGALRPGQTVIEATSGNTGIGLAMVCARKGYPLVVTMAESFSLERRRLLRFLGARVVLTPASEKGSGMLAKAIELAEAHGYFLCRQFENEANAEVHSRTTAREILDDFQGEPIHAWVTGFGTGGTLKGVSRVLKAADPRIRIVVAEPDNAPLLGSGEAQPAGASHPRFRPHLMQGWSPDFISPLTQQAWWTRSCRWREKRRCAWPESWPARRVSSSVSRPARPWPQRWTWHAGHLPAAMSCACCPTRVSATSPRRCSRASGTR